MNPFLRAPYLVAGRLAALAALVADAVPSGGGKLRRSLAGRAGVLERVRAWSAAERSPSAPLVWIHAPSVGEGLMAKPIIDRIRHERPDAQIAYTYFSPSAEQFAESLRVDIADYLPFDTTEAAEVMLDALKPAVIVFSKLDVWPLLAAEATARHVRLVLTSAAIGEASGRRSTFARLLLSDAYASLDAVGAAHEADASRLVQLGVKPDCITVTGDVRYDQVWERVSAPSMHAGIIAALASDRPTVVAGSTWPGDETCLFDGWPALRAALPGARLIIAPHEPTETALAAIDVRAGRLGLSCARLAVATGDSDIVLVDRMGILADLYALADVAYVGGGFHEAGLHSVVEPAAHAAPVVFGPRHTESHDAMMLIAAGGGFSVASGAALATRVAALAAASGAASGGRAGTQTRSGESPGQSADSSAGESPGERARGVIAAGLGAADRSAALVLRLLRPLRLSR